MRITHAAAFALLAGLAMPALAQDADDTKKVPAEGEAPLETIPVDQQQADPLPAEEAVTLDSIEVTAQRRVQRLVDVPLAVSAMSQDQVEARGIDRLDDLNSLAPGLQVSRSPANTTISQLTIRASSQINPAIYWDPAVGVYLDGVYIGKAQGSIFNIVDLSSVEVLRGPQGTLYGRNTIAGTINFITREPSGHNQGNVTVERGDFNDEVYRISLDHVTVGPASFTVGARKEHRDPWVTATPTSPVAGLNDRNSEAAHIAALIDVYDGVEALYRYDYSEVDQANTFLQLVNSDDPDLQPYVTKGRRTTADINAPSREYADVEGHSLILTWTLADWLTAKSISGMREVTWLDQLDLDGTPEDVGHSMRDTDYEQLSQDLTLSGQISDFHYTVGGYYFEDDGYTNNPIFVVVTVNGVDLPVDFDSRYGTHSEAWAGYGQLDWNVPWLRAMTVSAGARYTSETKDLDRVFGFRFDPNTPYTYFMPEGYRTDGVKFTATTPMAAIAYRVAPEVNTYVRYAEGFKSGGYNGEYSDVPPTGTAQSNQRETNTPFRPEKQESWEAGVKTGWFDGRLLANVAAFHNKLEDLQASIFTATGAAATVVRNAGKATVEGVELEAAYIPIDGTTLRVNYAWLDATYDEFLDAGQNVADNRAFVHAPEESWNAVIDSDLFHTPFGTVRAVVDYVWTDSFYTYPYQLRTVDSSKQTAGDSRVEAQGLLNASLSLAGIPLGGSRLAEITAWGHNLLDEDVANNYIDFGAAFQNLIVANFVEPRTVGVSAVVRW